MILSIKNLSFGYADQEVFDDLNFGIEEGAICGLLGLNGMGKSTLIKLIMGLKQPTAGEISLFGQKLTPANRDQLIEPIGVLIEQAPLYEHLTAFENLKIIQMTRRLSASKIVEALDKVSLGEFADRKVKSFSMGMKQRLGLALAMMANPKFIILDEPTNGLDPLGVAAFRKTVIALNKELGITFLISTHILGDLEEFATDFCILHEKKIVASGKIKDLHNKDLTDQMSLKTFFMKTVQ